MCGSSQGLIVHLQSLSPQTDTWKSRNEQLKFKLQNRVYAIATTTQVTMDSTFQTPSQDEVLLQQSAWEKKITAFMNRLSRTVTETRSRDWEKGVETLIAPLVAASSPPVPADLDCRKDFSVGSRRQSVLRAPHQSLSFFLRSPPCPRAPCGPKVMEVRLSKWGEQKSSDHMHRFWIQSMDLETFASLLVLEGSQTLHYNHMHLLEFSVG
ncbi:uncharacterized protein HKW66_Vig0110740 [Vigna angularis]|uniref:Uncharacterized protein n=1 Tax=Phaseolus angularis TaxID=3914 RepID=A0A8T0KY44_PHAAN|nr:uncharacterized protein HKW66_Vig0110740 [Vigna angularis]